MIQKIKNFIKSHKVISVIILIVIVVGIYLLLKKNTKTETHYVTEIVKSGSIQTTVTGTGQVEASNTITLNAKASGDITSVSVSAGQAVTKGQLIATVDSRDAKVALETAQIALDKLTNPNSLTVLQKDNSFTKSYNDGFDTVSSYVTDTTSMIDGVNAIYDNGGFLSNSNIANTDGTVRSRVGTAEDSFYLAKKGFDSIVKTYKSLSRSSSNSDIEKLVADTYANAKLMSLAMKNTEDAFNYLVNSLDNPNDSTVTSNRTNISSWVNNTNTYASNLLGAVNSISESQASISDNSDIRSAQLSLQTKQDAYNDCFITAPFDGIVATLTAKVGEPSGSSIGTLITKQKVATVSFNEVDIASIKLGQKANLTFDAIPDLAIDGVVSEIDSVGTVSSGVVTYDVKISLNEDNASIKPGMSVNAEIITNYKDNVLKVSSSAVKTKNGSSYVEMFATPLANSETPTGAVSQVLPNKQEVVTGLSDDTSTEIVFGLNEGDQIVAKTIAGTATTKTTAPSILNTMSAGARTGGGGASAGARVPRMD